MKKFVLLAIGILIILACSTSKKASEQIQAEVEIAADSTEYELLVFDPKFESFLVSQPYPKEYYSVDYYRQWNIRYCAEWNIRHLNPFRYGSFYETNIPYEAQTDYGLDFNFRLYQYFQFIEKEYGIVLVSRRGKPLN